MAYVAITRRAAFDIDEITQYSVNQWGQQVADDYLDSIDQLIQSIKENPQLLRQNPEVSAYLQLYRARSHFLVCATIDGNIYIVTVKHGSMDLPNRIAELEPLLLDEAKFLHEKFLESMKSK